MSRQHYPKTDIEIHGSDFDSPNRTRLEKFIIFILSFTFLTMLLVSVMLSTTMFSAEDSDKMVLISITMVGLSCIFGCGVYSYADYNKNATSSSNSGGIQTSCGSTTAMANGQALLGAHV
jgi:hypothetical protein